MYKGANFWKEAALLYLKRDVLKEDVPVGNSRRQSVINKVKYAVVSLAVLGIAVMVYRKLKTY